MTGITFGALPIQATYIHYSMKQLLFLPGFTDEGHRNEQIYIYINSNSLKKTNQVGGMILNQPLAKV